MVNTRAQAPQNNLPREDEMDDFEDNTSDLSLAEICTHPFELVSNDQNYEDSERDFDRVRTERKFNEMNRQIGELTSLVRTLIEKVSSRMATIHLEVDQRAILALWQESLATLFQHHSYIRQDGLPWRSNHHKYKT